MPDEKPAFLQKILSRSRFGHVAKQLELVTALCQSGLITQDDEGFVSAIANPAAKAFNDAFAATKQHYDATKDEYERAIDRLRGNAHELNSKMMTTKASNDFGYFCVDLGLGGAPPVYSGLAEYYPKIEKNLQKKPKLLQAFQTTKELANTVMELHNSRIRNDYLGVFTDIKHLFLELPVYDFDFSANGFLARPFQSARTTYLETYAALGAKAPEQLRKYAKLLEQYQPKAQGGKELAQAAREFATAIEATGLPEKFTAFSKDYSVQR